MRKNCYTLSVLSLILAIVILIAQIVFTGLLGIDLIKSYWVLFSINVALILITFVIGLYNLIQHKKFLKVEWISISLMSSSIVILALTFILELILKP